MDRHNLFLNEMTKDLKQDIHNSNCTEELAKKLVNRGWVKLMNTEDGEEKTDNEVTENPPSLEEDTQEQLLESSYKCPWNSEQG